MVAWITGEIRSKDLRAAGPLRGVEHLSVTLFFFQAEDGIRDKLVTGVQTCALPISTVQPWTTVGSHCDIRCGVLSRAVAAKWRTGTLHRAATAGPDRKSVV